MRRDQDRKDKMKMRRREFLGAMGAGAGAVAEGFQAPFTEFQIGCMTLAWAAFPFERGWKASPRPGIAMWPSVLTI